MPEQSEHHQQEDRAQVEAVKCNKTDLQTRNHLTRKEQDALMLEAFYR